MNIVPNLAQSVRRLRQGRADQRGGVAVLGAVVALPLTLLAFGAVDFHRLSNARENLQDGLDGATLAVARSAEIDPVKQNALGRTVLLASVSGPGDVVTSSSFVDDQGTVTGSASLDVTPVISSLFGVRKLTTSATSQASRLGRKLEVALVLDNTYSMLTNSRLTFTINAASAFVDKLSAAAVKTRVADALKVSLVPYSSTVNVGPGYRNAGWMDTSAVNSTHDDIFSAPANRFTLLAQMGVSWAGCVESRPYPYDVFDTPPRSTDPDSLFVPFFAPDEHDTWVHGWGAGQVPFSNNYLSDRSNSTDWFARQRNPNKYVTAPNPPAWSENGYTNGPNYNCNLQPIVRLTTDVAAVKSGIASMRATGDTYSNMGLMWGWHTLSPNAPFADGSAYTAPVQKIVVLMTDGENALWNNRSDNQSIYSGGGYIDQNRFGVTAAVSDPALRRAALDARMSQVCTNMKAAGVVIYTIRVEVTTASNVVRDCATDPSMFYDVKAAADLGAVFDAIAKSLLNLRLAA